MKSQRYLDQITSYGKVHGEKEFDLSIDDDI